MVSSVDELADNENDEKWITKAIKNAGKKAEAAALKRHECPCDRGHECHVIEAMSAVG